MVREEIGDANPRDVASHIEGKEIVDASVGMRGKFFIIMFDDRSQMTVPVNKIELTS